jgi:hypothetical protein
VLNPHLCQATADVAPARDEAGGSVAIDDQGRIVVAGSSRVGDPTSGDRYGVVARLMP